MPNEKLLKIFTNVLLKTKAENFSLSGKKKKAPNVLNKRQQGQVVVSNFLGLLQLGTDNTGKPKKNSCSNTSFILYKHAVVTLCHGNVQKVCTVYSNLLCDGIWCSSSRMFTTCSTYSIFGTHQSVHAFSYPCVIQVFLIGTNESNMPICRHMAHTYYTEFSCKKKAMPVLYKLPSLDMYFTGTSLLQKLLKQNSTQTLCHQIRNA